MVLQMLKNGLDDFWGLAVSANVWSVFVIDGENIVEGIRETVSVRIQLKITKKIYGRSDKGRWIGHILAGQRSTGVAGTLKQCTIIIQ